MFYDKMKKSSNMLISNSYNLLMTNVMQRIGICYLGCDYSICIVFLGAP